MAMSVLTCVLGLQQAVFGVVAASMEMSQVLAATKFYEINQFAEINIEHKILNLISI